MMKFHGRLLPYLLLEHLEDEDTHKAVLMTTGASHELGLFLRAATTATTYLVLPVRLWVYFHELSLIHI